MKRSHESGDSSSHPNKRSYPPRDPTFPFRENFLQKIIQSAKQNPSAVIRGYLDGTVREIRQNHDTSIGIVIKCDWDSGRTTQKRLEVIFGDSCAADLGARNICFEKGKKIGLSLKGGTFANFGSAPCGSVATLRYNVSVLIRFYDTSESYLTLWLE